MIADLFGDFNIERQRIRNNALDAWYAGSVEPELEKVGKEGYIHGYICVRPPCGKYAQAVTDWDAQTITADGKKIADLQERVGDMVETRHADDTVLSNGDVVNTYGSQTIRRVISYHNTGALARYARDNGDDKTATALERAQSQIANGAKYTAYAKAIQRAGGAAKDKELAKRVNETADYASTPIPEEAIDQVKAALRGSKPAKPVFGTKPLNALRPGKVPATMAEATQYYMSDGDVVNEFLRTGRNTGDYDDDQLRGIAGNMDLAIQHGALSEPATMYRGVIMTPEMKQALSQSKVSFTDAGFISTTSNPGIALQYAAGTMGPAAFSDMVDGAPMVMKITVPSGTNVMKGDPESKELVLPRNSKFKVTGTSSSVISLELAP